MKLNIFILFIWGSVFIELAILAFRFVMEIIKYTKVSIILIKVGY